MFIDQYTGLSKKLDCHQQPLFNIMRFRRNGSSLLPYSPTLNRDNNLFLTVPICSNISSYACNKSSETRRLEFEWNQQKAKSNLQKHGVSFIEAVDVFNDDFSSTVLDPDSSRGEFRYLTFGRTSAFRYLVVSYTERSDRVRIISARKMTPRERKAYEE